MDGELEFAALYKRIIDANFAPRSERAETALLAVLGGLSAPEPPDDRGAAAEEAPEPPGRSRAERTPPRGETAANGQTGKESNRCKI